MKNLLFLLLISCCLCPSFSNAQCLEGSLNCGYASSTLSCFPFTSTTITSDTVALMPGCTNNAPMNNPNWFFLEVNSSDLHLRITPSACTGAGIRAGLYSSCGSGATPVALSCDCSNTGDIDLVATGLSPNVYLLLIDACSGNVCDFEIDLINGQMFPPDVILGNIQANPSEPCEGQQVTFSIADLGWITNYNWTFPSGVTVLNTDCNQASVIWGGADGMVSVEAETGTCNTETRTLSVQIPTLETSLSASYCETEQGFFYNGNLYPAGVHDILFTSTRGCDSIVHLTVLTIPAFSTSISTQFCAGSGFTYLGQFITQPGAYDFVLQTFQGCDSIITLVVEELPAPLITIDDIINDTCSSCVGGVNLSVNSGSPPFTYLWNNGATTGNLVDACEGIYWVEVVDAIGCSAVDSLEVTNVSAGDLSVNWNSNEPLCFNSCDGNIELLIDCGIAPFSIDWADSTLPDNQTAVSNLCPGTYDVTVTDDTGNSRTMSIPITELPEIIVVSELIEPSCSGEADGEIDLTVNGGTPNYFFLWSNGANAANVTGLATGTYIATIFDTDGCQTIEVFTLTEPSELVVNIESANIACQSIGNVAAMAIGGTPPYSYVWNTNEQTATILVNQVGTYSVTVADANNCVAIGEVDIDDSFMLQMTSTPAGCDSTGGTATVTIGGAVTNPSYLWSNGGVTATINDLAPGGYSVTVTDGANGCLSHRNVIVPLDTACFVRISGYVYNDDVNRDCITDSTTVPLANVLISLSNGDFATTDQNGFYEFTLLAGSYTAKIILNTPQYAGLCVDSIDVNATTFGQSYTDNNFYVHNAGINNLGLKVTKQNARPGFSQRIRICVMNYGSTPVDGTLTFVHDPIQVFSNSPQTPTSYDAASQTLKWDFTDHLPGRTLIYYVYFDIPVSTSLGTSLNMYFRADPTEFDITPYDNEINCSFVVTGSYDPNDKQVFPTGEGAEGNISRQDSVLSYLIRFQNTGTDTAFTVVVRDTLDANLDMTTLVPGPSSHPYELNIYKGRILEFTFNDILLADSFVNEPASNGFVFFDIQVKPGLEYGDMVSNTASIFFDFNAPVITNTVVNTLKMPVGVGSPDENMIPLQLLPNPNQGKGLLRYQLEESEVVRIRLFDLQGRLVEMLQGFEEQQAGAHQLPLDLIGQEAGMYFLHLETAKGEYGIIRWVYLD